MPYLDILLFAIVAFVLITRLGKILGQDSSEEDRANIEQTWAKTFEEKAKRKLEKQEAKINSESQEDPVYIANDDIELTGVDAGFSDIAKADSTFNPTKFLDGSKIAFEMVLKAFIDGDKDTLQNLLDTKLYTKFASVIDIRTAEGHTSSNDLIAIDVAEPVSARLDGKIAIVEVKFVSQQINVTLDENENVVDGHLQAIDTITDVWTFERDVKSKAPNWMLTHTRTIED